MPANPVRVKSEVCLPSDAVGNLLPAHNRDAEASQVLRRETSAFGDARQHARADLLVVVKGEHEVCPAISLERSM